MLGTNPHELLRYWTENEGMEIRNHRLSKDRLQMSESFRLHFVFSEHDRCRFSGSTMMPVFYLFRETLPLVPLFIDTSEMILHISSPFNMLNNYIAYVRIFTCCRIFTDLQPNFQPSYSLDRFVKNSFV